MREIIFRGKIKRTGEWIYGFYGENSGTGDAQISPIKDCCFKIIIPETVGQYTGLCDKNGKKIFEGDIIHSLYANCKINEHIEKVVFRDGAFKSENAEGGFFAKIAGQGSPKHLPNDTSVYMIECEIIGNIHDNPELLKGGADNDT
jgi:uncharacterized phage protein (TIGR01671 family)